MATGSKKRPSAPKSSWDDEPTVIWSPPEDWLASEEEETTTLGPYQDRGVADTLTDAVGARGARDDTAPPSMTAPLPLTTNKSRPAPPKSGDPESQSQSGVESRARPAVEVEVRKVSIETARRLPGVYEIWTKNRVYNLDANLACIEVIDLATGQPKPDHPFVGAKLAGGQKQTEKHHEMSFPLPSPGSEAVFQKQDHRNRIRLSLTSPVTRVILHIQRAQVPIEKRDQAWGRITATEPQS